MITSWLAKMVLLHGCQDVAWVNSVVPSAAGDTAHGWQSFDPENKQYSRVHESFAGSVLCSEVFCNRELTEAEYQSICKNFI